MKKFVTNPRLIIWAAVSLFVIDRLLKDMAVRTAPACVSFVDFSLYLNRGLAFSLRVPPLLFWLLMGVGTMALVWATVYRVRQRGTWPLALIVVALGAASNLYDRLVGGAVVDYFLLFCRSAFNIADIMIVGGLLWAVLEEKR